MITIKLGKVSRSGSNSTARMTESIEIDCVLKNATSINTPTFIINGEPTDANQLIWNNVYYDITNVTIINNDHYSIECVKNVLATYKNEIEEKAHFFDVISSNNKNPETLENIRDSILSIDSYATDFDRPSDYFNTTNNKEIDLGLFTEEVSYVIQTSTIHGTYFICDYTALEYILNKFIYDTEASVWEQMSPDDLKSVIAVPISYIKLSNNIKNITNGSIHYTNWKGNQTLEVSSGRIFEATPGVYSLGDTVINKSDFLLSPLIKDYPWITTSTQYSSYYITVFGQVFQIPNYYFNFDFTIAIKYYLDIASFNICATVKIDDNLLGTTECRPIGSYTVQNYNALQAYNYQFSKISQSVTDMLTLSTGVRALSQGISFKPNNLDTAVNFVKNLNVNGNYNPPVCESRGSNLSNYEVIKYAYTRVSTKGNVKINKLGISANVRKSLDLTTLSNGFYRTIETINFNALSEDINAVNLALLSGFYYE